MDSVIPLGQKNSLAEFMILFGADNRPPTLDKDLTKKYVVLSATEKMQADCDIKATNIILQGSPQPTINLELPLIREIKPLIQDGRVIVKQVSGRQGQSYSSTGYKSNATSFGGNNASGQAKLRNAAWYKDKAMLAEAQEAGQILDEEQLAFLVDLGVLDDQAIQTIIPNNAAFQTEDLDTYDSDCDDVSNAKAVLMANISNYGSDVISDVPHFETYLNDMENQMNKLSGFIYPILPLNFLIMHTLKWKFPVNYLRRGQLEVVNSGGKKLSRVVPPIEAALVKEKQEKDKIGTKPNKNGKRRKAQQCQSPVTVEKAEKRRNTDSRDQYWQLPEVVLIQVKDKD
uniref:Retrovirus-related Pol polyprotein from transposon TNT 1-94 n=1 Tax=Tanacetum cinerariifolium TaxID=118510 RepID=A0A6L2K6U7_TANCI|nr:hypothetical protein [Tanacetum cinerariifolium]